MLEVAPVREDHEIPAASAASTTSWSRLDPPGLDDRVTPASTASCGPVGEREERVGRERRAGDVGAAAAAFSIASRTESTRLIGRPDADERQVGESTIALGARACRPSSELHLAPTPLGRLALADNLHLERSFFSRSMSRSWSSSRPSRA
jgi:hypothetical protein